MAIPPATCLEARLASKPAGLPSADNIAIVEVPLPRPRSGEVLVRNVAFRLSATIRMMISEGAEAIPGVPIPALEAGDAMHGEAIGEVVETAGEGDLRVGDLVLHHHGWRDYAAVSSADCQPVNAEVGDPLLHLSHGWTAYAALTRGLKINSGETVLVTGASGAIGSMAGQIARLLGAARVIGTTSTPGKAERLISELGYDAAIARAAGPIAKQLAAAAPGGVDAVIDCVGGEQLRAAVDAARPGARILVIGALSGQLAAAGSGRSAPVELDSFAILLKRLSIRGYSADDDPDARGEWEKHLAAWTARGAIHFPLERVSGLRNAPAALARASRGGFFGTIIVTL